MTFTHRFTHYFVEFCRDRRLRTFLKVVQKNLQHTCLKRGRGGGQGPFKQCLKKLHNWFGMASLSMALENVIVKGDIIRQSGQKLNGLARRPIVFYCCYSESCNRRWILMTNTYKIDSLSLKFHLFLCQNPSVCIKSNKLKDKHA